MIDLKRLENIFAVSIADRSVNGELDADMILEGKHENLIKAIAVMMHRHPEVAEVLIDAVIVFKSTTWEEGL